MQGVTTMMNAERIIYIIYTLFFALFMVSIIAVPFLAFENDMKAVYDAFAPACHQKLSRSLCLFSQEGGYWIADCKEQNWKYVGGESDRDIKVEETGITGYKFPVCARDMALYGFIVIGAVLYPFIIGIDNRKVYPAIYLIAALVPIGIDGGLQFFSQLHLLPFEYESINSVRMATGAIAGFAASFYAIPILVNLFSVPKTRKTR